MNGTTLTTLTRSEFNSLTSDLNDTKKMIAVEESETASHAYQQGNYLIFNNNLYKVRTAISIGDTLSTSTNIILTDTGHELKATASSGGGGESITPPVLTTSTLTYNGTAQSPIFTGFDEDTMIAGGNTATNAGTYSMAVALMNGNNTWSDTNDSYPKTYFWTMQKAQAILSVSTNAVTLDNENPSVTITITRTGDGILSIDSTDDSVCSTSMDGNVCTITATTHLLKTTTLTFSLSETSNWHAPNDVTVEVTAAYAAIVSWAEGTDEEITALVELADNGYIDLYEDCGWRVGDTRTVAFAAYSGYSLPTQDIDLVLMHHGGMNLAEAVASGRTKCSFVVGMKDVFVDSNNSGKTAVYYYATDTYTSWSLSAFRTMCNREQFKACFPSTLIGIFKQFTHSIVSQSTTPSVVTYTDQFSFPTEKNILGTRNCCYQIEFNATDNFQFEYYKTTTNRIKYDKTAAKYYWLCSPGTTDKKAVYVNASGSTGQQYIYKELCFSVFGVI